MKYKEMKPIIDAMFDTGRLPFIALHMLFQTTNACPNKDKTGMQKTAAMDVIRTIISSQAIRMPVREGFTKDGEIRTRRAGEIVLARYKKEYKNKHGVSMPADLETQLVTTIMHVIKPPQNDEEGDQSDNKKKKKEMSVEDKLKTEILVLSKDDMEEIYNEIAKQFETVIKDGVKPEEAGQAARDILIKTSPQRGIGIATALFGRMTTNQLLGMVYAAIQSSFAFAVNAREETLDYYVAKDDFASEIIKYIDNEAEFRVHNGAGMMDEESISSDIMYEFHAINMKTLIQSILSKANSAEPDAIEKAHALARAGVAQLIRNIVDLRAVGGQTRHYDINTPNCLAVYLSNGFAKTASGAYWRAIDRKVADTESIKVLTKALDERRFRSKYEIRKGYWVVDPRFDDLDAPEGYKRTTVDDIVDEIENEKWDHDFSCKE